MNIEKIQNEIVFYNEKAKECYDFALKTENLNARYKNFNIGKYCSNVATNLEKIFSILTKEKYYGK